MNWYCAGALSDCFARVAVSATPWSWSRSRRDHSPSSSGLAPSAHATFYALYAGLAAGDANLTRTLAAYARARAFADADVGVPCGSYPVQFLLGGGG